MNLILLFIIPSAILFCCFIISKIKDKMTKISKLNELSENLHKDYLKVEEQLRLLQGKKYKENQQLNSHGLQEAV